MKNVEEYARWLRLARNDLKASMILYKKELFPQSFYLLSQALEKTAKGLLLTLKLIGSGQEIGHYIKAALSIVASTNYSQIVKNKTLMKKLDKKRPIAEDDFIRMESLLSHLPKLKDWDEKGNIPFCCFVRRYALSHMEYALSCIGPMAEFIPQQETFRYPEYNPNETYDEEYPLRMYYLKIYKHLSKSIDIIENILLKLIKIEFKVSKYPECYCPDNENAAKSETEQLKIN